MYFCACAFSCILHVSHMQKKNGIMSKVLLLPVSQYKHAHWTKSVMVLNCSDLVEVKI